MASIVSTFSVGMTLRLLIPSSWLRKSEASGLYSKLDLIMTDNLGRM